METGGSPGPISLAGYQWCSPSFQVNMHSSKNISWLPLFSRDSVKLQDITQLSAEQSQPIYWLTDNKAAGSMT